MDRERIRQILRDAEDSRMNARLGMTRTLAERNRRLSQLRDRMFPAKPPEGTAFAPLHARELALLDWKAERFAKRGRFLIADKELKNRPMREFLEVLRQDHLCGTNEIDPRMFRNAADKLIRLFLSQVLEGEMRINPKNCTFVLPWRGALAFAFPAQEWGVRNWQHFGVVRDEETAKPAFYFTRPVVLRRNHTYVTADPMLATGGTQIAVIERLLRAGVREENIVVASLVSAPEGVDRIFHKFPGIRIATVAHDHHLNALAYIVPGLGDFGDKYFRGFSVEDARIWANQGIMGAEALASLTARMIHLERMRKTA